MMISSGRRSSKCVIRGGDEPPSPQASRKVRRPMPHAEFMQRIRKSLYFGGAGGTVDSEDDDDDFDDDLEISRPLAEYASELFSAPHKGHSLNRLNSVAAGAVHATTPCSLLMALIYLDRLNATDPGYVRRITPQELFIVSMMISTKFYAGHDESIYLSDWAEDGNMTDDRLKQLELEFLCAIDWNIYISNEQFFAKLSTVEKTLAQREGLRRGWLTYAELMHMLPSFTLAKFLLNNITIMAVSYAASVMTIAGAFFLASQIPGNALHRKTLDALSTTSATTAPTTTHTIEAASGVGGGGGEIPTEALLDPHSARINASEIATVVTAATQPHNASCTALNVEAELLKLERQYAEEAQREEDLRRRQRFHTDIVPAIALAFWASADKASSPPSSSLPADSQRNWLALKSEYSDLKQATTFEDAINAAADISDFADYNAFLPPPSSHSELAQNLPMIADCLSSAEVFGRNCTTTTALFWHILADAAHQSLVRLPTLWFKFI